MSLPSKDLEALREDAERLAVQLPRSSSRDEALDIAIKAAETAMQALKLAKDPRERTQLSTRANQLLREAERIKTDTNWRPAIQSSPTANAGGKHNGVKSRARNEPLSTRKMSTREQKLLLQASFLNGFKFPPWTTPPKIDEFELKDGEELFLYV